MEARAYHQTKAFVATTQFAQTEGIVSAPETSWRSIQEKDAPLGLPPLLARWFLR